MSANRENYNFSLGPSYRGGEIVGKTGGWRTFRPVLDSAKCKMCLLCWIYCPDGAIKRGEKEISIDYDYCKGCGICEKECNLGAIKLIRE